MKILMCEQGTQEWLDARVGIPTASNADRIITPAKGEFSTRAYDYACELIAERFCPIETPWVDDYQSPPMAAGSAREQESRRFYQLERDVDVLEVGFCLTDDGRFGCSPDGLVGEDGGLELKNPLHKTQIKYLLANKLPTEYQPQVHFSMCVTKRPWWDFLSYADRIAPLLVRVTADEYTVKMAVAMEQFDAMLRDMTDKVMRAGDPVACTREPYLAPF